MKKTILNSVLTCLLLTTVFFLGHQLAVRHRLRLDLTAGHLYSLDPASRETLAKLPQPLKIKIFISKDLPARFAPVSAYIRSLMAEYVQAGAGKLMVEFIDPGNDPLLIKQAENLGISETRANITAKDKVEMVRIWFGMVLIYQEKQKVFPTLEDIHRLEYDITAAIRALIRPHTAKILVAAPPNRPLDLNQHPIFSGLGQKYDIQTLDKNLDSWNLYEAEAIIAWKPQEMDEHRLYLLEQYMLAGGPLMLLANGVEVESQSLYATPRAPGPCDAWFHHLGFRLSRKILADTRCSKIRFSSGSTSALKEYPPFPMLHASMGQFAPTGAAFHELEGLILPWTTPLEIEDAKGNVLPVAQSSDQAWLLKTPLVLNPERLPGPTQFATYLVGLRLEGPRSAFFERPPDLNHQALHLARGEKTRLLVWGSDAILEQAQNQATQMWMANCLHDLLGEAELAGIHRQAQAFQPIRELSPGEKSRYKWLSITLSPGVLLLLAALASWQRKRWNHREQEAA